MKLKNFVKTEDGEELAVLCLDLGYQLAGTVSDLTRHQINFLMAALNRRQRIRSIRSRMREGGTSFIFE